MSLKKIFSRGVSGLIFKATTQDLNIAQIYCGTVWIIYFDQFWRQNMQKRPPKEVNIKALPGVLGNRGIRPFISGEQGNKGLKVKGTRE